MNPSSFVDAPPPASPPPRSGRHRPLSPVGGWRWLWSHRAEGSSPNGRRATELPQKQSATRTAARVRRMNRIAPAVLLWAFVCYAIAQIALLLSMDDTWQPTRVKTEHQKFQALREWVAEAPDRPLVLMLGSSRTDWGFQAARLSGQPGPDGRPLLAYNFGVPTAGPMHEALYLRDLLAEGIRPRLLLVEFVATHFNEPRRNLMSEEDMIDAPCLTASQLAYYARHFSHPSKKVRQWIEGRLAPWYTFRYNFHKRLQETDEPKPWDPASRPMDQWGWRLLSTEAPTDEHRAVRWAGAHAMYAASLQQFRFAAGPTRSMHELLARCRDERIPVALVLMPTCEQFRVLYNPDALAQLRRFVDELCAGYGADLIDATDWLAIEDFDDGHHVLHSGARNFTTRLIGEVQDLLKRNATVTFCPRSPASPCPSAAAADDARSLADRRAPRLTSPSRRIAVR